MSLRRMAYRLSLLCFAILTTLSILAAAQPADISDEILNFVPPCAQRCFRSFISANFDSAICGNSPSLQCLCQQQGSSGYTIGEGAVSCLVAESKHGPCQGQDGGSDARETAYYMCVGISDAAPMTHSTIFATLVLPPSGTGHLLVPTAHPTTTGTDAAAGTTTSKSTPTVRLPTGDKSSSTAVTSSSSTAAATSSSKTTTIGLISPTQTPETAAGMTKEDQPRLTTSQIVGIALGSTAVVVFGIVLVFLAKCIRRRRFGDMESGFSKMRESVSFGGKKNSPGFSHGNPHITGPLFDVQPQRNPADQLRVPGLPRAGVGLAISQPAIRDGGPARQSPARAPPVLNISRPPTPPPKPKPVSVPKLGPPPRRAPKPGPKPAPDTTAPAARQSPPKPTLTLAIPKAPERMIRAPISSRDSVVTEFAEDGEGDAATGLAIWRPPTTDSLSATTVYSADKGGNWILRNPSARQLGQESTGRAMEPTRQAIQEVPAAPVEVELPSPEHKTRAERARDAYGEFLPDALVSPLRLPSKQSRQRLGSPISFKDQRREPKISNTGISARLSQTAETIMSESPQTGSQPIDTYFATMRESRDLTGGRARRRSAPKFGRRMSQESATSIESAAEDDGIIGNDRQANLSPVVEQVHTPVSPGKSAAKQPAIRRYNDEQQQQPPPPPNGATGSELLPPAHRYNVWYPPGRSSPTGRSSMVKSGPYTPAASQYGSSRPERARNTLNLGPATSGNPGGQRTRPPEANRGSLSAAELEARYWQRQQQIANPASYWNDAPQMRAQPPPPPRPRQSQRRQPQLPLLLTPPYELPEKNSAPSSSFGQYGTPKEQQQLRPPLQQRRPGFLPTPAATPQSQQSGVMTDGTPSGSGQQDQSQGSNLLAKRRGAEKAAALVLPGAHGDGAPGVRRGKSKWTKVETTEENVPPAPPIAPGGFRR